MSGRQHTPRIAILASGSGSTAEAFVEATVDGRVDAEVGLIVCNNPPETAGIYARAARLNALHGLQIEVAHISGKTHPKGNIGRGQTLAESEAICELLHRGEFDHVGLMGYMKLVRGALINEYGWLPTHTSEYQARMTNTHPGPLPETEDTYGRGTSQKVLDLGLTMSKHSVHLVAAGVDKGPVIAAHPVEVLEGDTAQALFDRVQIAEKVGLPYAIGNFLIRQQEYYANS